MRIGVDLDNTIACYDGVFHAAARERGLIPADLATDKSAVRDHLNNAGRRDDFTELQGYVYGACMDRATLYPGAADFVAAARAKDHDVYVLSHRSRAPERGPPHDLHAAAQQFLKANGLIGDALIPDGCVLFEETREGKLARADALGLDVLIDDLPEVLADPSFPRAVRGVLFDPHGRCPGGRWNGRVLEAYASWSALRDSLLG